MKKSTLEQAVVYAFLIFVGVAGRLWCDIPNFAPVTAISLFAGFYFQSLLAAISVPLIIMTISDSLIGGYEPMMMITVYTMLALPVFLRSPVRKRLRRKSIGATVGMVGICLTASVAFFLVTNFVVWLTWERALWDRLIPCYVNAIPFFRYTIAGDLIYAIVLFGSYSLMTHPATMRSDQPNPGFSD